MADGGEDIRCAEIPGMTFIIISYWSLYLNTITIDDICNSFPPLLLTDVLNKGLRACLRCSLLKTFSQVSLWHDFTYVQATFNTTTINNIAIHFIDAIWLKQQSFFDVLVRRNGVWKLWVFIDGEQQWKSFRGQFYGQYYRWCLDLIAHYYLDLWRHNCHNYFGWYHVLAIAHFFSGTFFFYLILFAALCNEY